MEKTIKIFKDASVPLVSDALDMLNIQGACRNIVPIFSKLKAVGPAYTVNFVPVSQYEKAPAGDYIDKVPSGSVIVVSNGGVHCTVWGDILSYVAKTRGIEGTVIDGFARDIPSIAKLCYPLFVRGVFMQSGKNRVRLIAQQVPIMVSHVNICPGDLVCGDGSGVVIVPFASINQVAEMILKIATMEKQVMDRIKKGSSLKEAREACRYHHFALKKKPVFLQKVESFVLDHQLTSGNPADILECDQSDVDPYIRKISEDHSFVTTFVFKETNAYRLRFFLGREELSLCVHGTIGAIAVLNKNNKIPKKGRIFLDHVHLRYRIDRDDKIFIISNHEKSQTLDMDHQTCTLLGEALGVEIPERGKLTIIGQTRPKLLMEFENPLILSRLKLHFEKIRLLSTRIGVTGLYCVAQKSSQYPLVYEARQFPHSFVTHEDSATGIALSAFAYYLIMRRLLKNGQSIKVYQGQHIGRPSLLEAKWIHSQLFVGGSVRLTCGKTGLLNG